jgi:predicted membrane-bound spermidine synthase
VAGARAIGPQPRFDHRASPRGALAAAVLAVAAGGLVAALAGAANRPAALYVGAGGVCAIALVLAAAVAALGPEPE